VQPGHQDELRHQGTWLGSSSDQVDREKHMPATGSQPGEGVGGEGAGYSLQDRRATGEKSPCFSTYWPIGASSKIRAKFSGCQDLGQKSGVAEIESAVRLEGDQHHIHDRDESQRG